MELLLHRSWNGMKLAVVVLQEGTFLVAPRGVLAVILQPSLFDLWMDLASEATWGGAAFTGGSRCGKAWNPSLVVGNGGMELEVTGVDGGHLSVEPPPSEGERVCRTFVHFKGLLVMGLVLTCVQLMRVHHSRGRFMRPRSAESRRIGVHFSLSLKYANFRAILHSNIFGQMFKPMLGELYLQLPTKSVYTTNFDPSGPDLPCAEWLTVGESQGKAGLLPRWWGILLWGHTSWTNAAIAAGSSWVRSPRWMASGNWSSSTARQASSVSHEMCRRRSPTKVSRAKDAAPTPAKALRRMIWLPWQSKTG